MDHCWLTITINWRFLTVINVGLFCHNLLLDVGTLLLFGPLQAEDVLSEQQRDLAGTSSQCSHCVVMTFTPCLISSRWAMVIHGLLVADEWYCHNVAGLLKLDRRNHIPLITQIKLKKSGLGLEFASQGFFRKLQLRLDLVASCYDHGFQPTIIHNHGFLSTITHHS